MKRLIESTDLFVAVNVNGDAHIFAGNEPILETNGVFCGMLLAYLGPARLYGLQPGSCVRLLFESTENISQTNIIH